MVSLAPCEGDEASRSLAGTPGLCPAGNTAGVFPEIKLLGGTAGRAVGYLEPPDLKAAARSSDSRG